MGVKIADKLEQFNNGTYYLVDSSAVEYVDKDGNTKSVKDVLDNGLTDNTESKFNTVAFTDNIDMGKYHLLAKITDVQYESHNIIRFSCNNFKGVYGTGYTYEDDVDVYRFDIYFNTGYNDPTRDRGITLKQHGLTLFSYPLNNPQNTSPEIKDAVRLYWDYTKNEIYVFLVDIMTSIPHCVVEYTGSGTLKEENCFVNDNTNNTFAGTAAKWANSNWKSIPYDKLETPPIYELGGESSGKVYTTLGELGLTTPITVGDIFNAMPARTTAIISCEDITVHITDAPTSYGILTIKKNDVGRFSIDYQSSLASSPCNVKRWIGTLKGNDGTGLYWKEVAYKDNIAIYRSLSELELDTTATLKDITRAMAKNSMIAIKVDAMADQSEYNSILQGTVTIYKIEDARIQAIMTEKSTGRTWVGILGGENTIIGWKELRSDSPFYRIVTQGVAGYFKFKPTSNGIDQPLRISVTDNYGGMINISGAKPTASQYKPFKCIRLSNGEYTNYDAIKVANNKMLKLFYYDGYFYLKVTTYTTCTFTGLIEAPTYVETFNETDAEEIPIRSVFDTPYNDGYADPSIIAIGDVDSYDGVIKTLSTLGFTGDVMTWDTGVYRVSHVGGLTNLPAEITEEKPEFRLEHYDVKKWGSNHNPTVSTYGCRQSIFHYKGNVFVRYTESGANAGVLIADTGWKKIQIGNTKETLAFNSKTFKIDITKGREAWNGNIKFGYCVDNSYGEIIISSLGATKVTWSCSEGVRYVKSVTYTIDPDNKAHVTIGVELHDIVYGVHQLETSGDFATINSFTGDAFTGTSVAERQGIRGRNNGVGILCEVADLGLTTPCTTVQIAQAMKNLSNYIGRIPTSGMIGIFDNGGNTITDAPSQYGLLQVNAYGYDRVMIRYDGIGSSSYTGSWIGKIKGSNGTFSEVTWERIDDNFNGKEVKSITIDLSASDLQSTGSGSVHLSLGNYIDKSTKAIRAEGYYNPPSDSTYPVVIPVIFGSQAGHLSTDSTGYSFRAVQSPSGKKGSGFVKIYYVE